MISGRSFRRFTVAEYHRLVELGIVTENDGVELIEGLLVTKPSPQSPAHDYASCVLREIIFPLLPAGWIARSGSGVTLADSETEPDLAIVRGDRNTYRNRHPNPADVGVVVEVADSSLDSDRADKCRIYARAGLPEYWIVNVVDGKVEVYTSPSGPTADPAYANRRDCRPGDAVPLVLDGATVAQLAVSEING